MGVSFAPINRADIPIQSAEYPGRKTGGESLPLSSPDVVEHPVPHDDEPGDDHVGEQAGTEEHPGDEHLVFHGDHASAGTVSAQLSTVATMASSEYEEIRTWSRLKDT